MKISIWQQFSSNHSANFTIIGQFKNPESARLTGSKIQDMMRAMLWVKRHLTTGLDFADQLARLQQTEVDIPKALTEPEFTKYMQSFLGGASLAYNFFLQDHYDLKDWQFRLDWMDEDSPERDVIIFDKLVIVSPARETWAGIQIFDDILGKLGAEVASSQEGGKGLVINLHCTIPSVKVANQLRDELTIEVEDDDFRFITIPDVGTIYLGADTEYHITDTAFELRRFEQPVIQDHDRNKLRLVEGLELLIQYFKRHGCTDIRYSFSEAK